MTEPVLVIGRYAIFGKIASGGMATVHVGRLLGSAGFTRTVAVKRLHPHLADQPEFVAMLTDEAHLAARIRHPNVAQTLDVVAADQELLVVMEYIHGEVVQRLLGASQARGVRIPLGIVSSIVSSTLFGLHAAHEAKSDQGVPLGIIHRDVSPQNVLVGADGVTRVIDFGIAKATTRIQTTRKGVLKGKPAYMAPEQVRGNATPQTDIYAVGVMLWEMLTSRRLFKADSDVELLGKVLAGTLESPRDHVPELSPDLDALVMRALAHDPADRFVSAKDMADKLLRVLPSASLSEVGAWVQEVANEFLEERKTKIAEIESGSNSVAASEQGPSISRGIEAATSHSIDREKAQTRGSVMRLIGGTASVAVLVGIGAAMGSRVVHQTGRPEAPAARATSTVAASVVIEQTPIPVAHPTSTGKPVSEQASAPSSIPTAVVHRRPPALPLPPSVDCNPPYRVDSTGVRVVKVGCY